MGACVRGGQRREPRLQGSLASSPTKASTPGCLRIARSSATSSTRTTWGAGGRWPPERRAAAVRQSLPRHPRALQPRFHRRVDVGDQQPSVEPLLGTKSPTSSPSAASASTSPIRSFVSIRDETALTRERPTPPAQAACRLRWLPRPGQGGRPAGRRQGGPRPCDEVAAQGGRSAARDARRLDRSRFRTDRDPGRRAARIPAHRSIARQPERALPPAVLAAWIGQARQALDQVVQVASLRANATAPAPAACWDHRQVAKERRRRREREFHRPDRRRDGSGRDGNSPCGDHCQPIPFAKS